MRCALAPPRDPPDGAGRRRAAGVGAGREVEALAVRADDERDEDVMVPRIWVRYFALKPSRSSALVVGGGRRSFASFQSWRWRQITSSC